MLSTDSLAGEPAAPSDRPSFTRQDIVNHLLQVTKLATIRKEVRHSQAWRAIFRGWRPDSLTRPVLLQLGAPQIARPGAKEFSQLCAVFLDGLGVPPAPNFHDRF